jgi:hypothetical protein
VEVKEKYQVKFSNGFAALENYYYYYLLKLGKVSGSFTVQA